MIVFTLMILWNVRLADFRGQTCSDGNQWLIIHKLKTLKFEKLKDQSFRNADKLKHIGVGRSTSRKT